MSEIIKKQLKDLSGNSLFPELQFDDNDLKTVNSVSGTYEEIKQLKDNAQLIPGVMYTITDYTCCYLLPTTSINIYDEYDGWLLHLIASTSNSFIEDISITFTEDSSYVAKGGNKLIACKYCIDNDKNRFSWAIEDGKGVIYYLKDVFDNEVVYDFKHIKFRRYRVKSAKPNKETGQYGAFRTFIESDPETKKFTVTRSDSRTWVGSGSVKDEEIIDSVFDGTFRTQLWGLEGSLTPLCIKQSIDPFTESTTGDRETYVASSSNFDNVFKNKTGVFDYPGLVEFDVDPDDYADFYTFDYQGEDASNLMLPDSTKYPKVRKVTLGRYSSNKTYTLTNTVYIINSDYFMCNVNISNGINSTVVLLYASQTPEGKKYLGRMENVNIELLYGSILYINLMLDVNITKLLKHSYCHLLMQNCNFENITGSVLFGMISTSSIKECKYNLWFNTSYILTTEGGSLLNGKDGEHTYNTSNTEGWFAFNIIGPFQYTNIGPHFNTNTIYGYYNKGNQFLGTTQYNYIKTIRWGGVVGYGALQGIMFNDVEHVEFKPQSLLSTLPDEAPLKISDWFTYEPLDVRWTDILTRYLNWPTVVANMSLEQKDLLASDTSSRKRMLLNGLVSEYV